MDNPKNTSYSTSELVNKAVGCISKDQEDWKVSGEKALTWERILPILMEEITIEKGHPIIDTEEFKISESHLKSRLREFLNEIKTEDNPGKYFINNIGEFKEKLGTLPENSYTIAFPLNITYKNNRRPDEYEVLGYEIERIGYGEWKANFEQVARSKEEESGIQDDAFTEFMEEIPNNISGTKQTFWSFEIQARDEKYAIEKLETLLRYLLGKVNASAKQGKKKGHSFTRSVWPKGFSKLKTPFVYIVKEDNSYQHFFYSEDISPRKRFKVKSTDRSKFDYYFDLFPELSYPLSTLEEKFVESVMKFQSAISEADKEESFLEYWRAIEALTLTTESDSMNEVIRRVNSAISHENQRLYQFRLKKARNKRNKLVHEGGKASITKSDQNLLKGILENLIWLYCNNLGDWSHEDFNYFFENAGSTEDELERSIEKLKRKLELSEDILEGKRYEENIFEKMYNDWRGKRSFLKDKNFIDTFRFFYPVFGVGNEESDVFVVSDFPVYPYGDQEIKKRDRIAGWSPQELFFPSIEKYRNFVSSIIYEGNPDGASNILETIASELDMEKDDLYYTTLQKDGRFNEEQEEIDGHDPTSLNESSIDAWSNYLREEIEEVNPNTIVVFGRNSLEALENILNLENSLCTNEVQETSRYTIVPFKYWSKIDTPEDSTPKEFIGTKI